MSTIEDLLDDLAFKEEQARFHLEAKADANREAMIQHLSFIRTCREADEIRRKLITAQGEST